MGKVGDIFVTVSGSSLGLTNALNKGIRSIDTFKIEALGLKSALTGIGTAIAGSAIIQGFTSFVQSGLEAIDTQTKLARDIGITTERFAELNYIAGLSGVSVDTLGMAFTKLGTNIVNGEKKTVEALTEIGLSFDDIRNMSLEDAFDSVHEALSKIESPAKKNALAMDLFSKAGLGIRGILNSTPEQINQMSEEARKLGLTFSDPVGSQVEAANDAMAKMSQAIQAASNAAAAQLAPSITVVADSTTDWLSDTKNGLASVLPGLDTMEVVMLAIMAVGRVWGVVWGTIKLVALAVLGVITLIVSAFAFLTGKGTEYAKTLKYEFKAMGEDVADTFDDALVADKSSPIHKRFDDARKSINDLTIAAGQAKPAIDKNLKKPVDEAAIALKKATENAVSYNESLKMQIDTFGATGAELEALKFAHAGVEGAITAEISANGDLLKQMQAKADLDAELADKAKALKEEIASPYDTALAKVEELKTLLNQGLINGEEFSTALDKMANEVEEKKIIITPQFSGGLSKFSQEARDAIFKFKQPKFESKSTILDKSNQSIEVKNNKLDSQSEYQKKLFIEQQKANIYLKKMAEKKVDEFTELRA